MSLPVPPPAPPAGAGAAASPGGTASVRSDLEVAEARMTQRPAADDLQAFGQAVASSHRHQMQAALPSSDGLGTSLMHQIDQLTQQMGSLQGGLRPLFDIGLSHAAHPGAAGPAADSMNTALGQMEHAYVLAIETTMASRGSTESTKIFNTLLKGQ